MADMKLFAGNATPDLAKKIADRLYTRLGNATVDRFSDGEVTYRSMRTYVVAISSSSSLPVHLQMTT